MLAGEPAGHAALAPLIAAVGLYGIALGLTASLLLTRFLRGFLYGLSPTDNLTYLGAAILWIVVAAIGSYLPARRATRVDPVQAVRSE